MIVGVAIRWSSYLIALPRPARHCDCLEQALRWANARADGDFTLKREQNPSGEQGFVDHRGRFLTREQALLAALRDAKRCGPLARLLTLQAVKDRRDYLLSEDLW